MGDFADRDAIDTLAATLFSRDHPDRIWDALTQDWRKLGVASAQERAVYRGFATTRFQAERRALPVAAIAAAALAADGAGSRRLKPSS